MMTRGKILVYFFILMIVVEILFSLLEQSEGFALNGYNEVLVGGLCMIENVTARKSNQDPS